MYQCFCETVSEYYPKHIGTGMYWWNCKLNPHCLTDLLEARLWSNNWFPNNGGVNSLGKVTESYPLLGTNVVGHSIYFKINMIFHLNIAHLVVQNWYYWEKSLYASNKYKVSITELLFLARIWFRTLCVSPCIDIFFCFKEFFMY